MKRVKRLLCAALAAVTLLAAAAFTAPRAYAEDYEDGTYTVSFSMDGLGRHNVAWSTATVHIEGGAIYVDFTLERVDPRDHAPQYDYLTTPCGTFYPTSDDATYTCTFSWVQVPHLGRVDVAAMTSAMSQPYEVEYVLHIDDAGIPVKQTQQPSTPSAPSTPSTPAVPGTPSTPAAPDTTEPATPDTPADASAFETFKAEQKATLDKLAQSGDSEAAKKLIQAAGEALDALAYDESKSLEENEKAVADLLAKLEEDLTAQRQQDEKTIAPGNDKKNDANTTGDVTDTAASEKKLSTGAIIGIVIAAVAVIGAGVAVVLKQRKKK